MHLLAVARSPSPVAPSPLSSANLEEDLFASVLALPEAERDKYLQRACGNDRDLHARVQTLVEAAGRLENEPLRTELTGDHIGDFKLLAMIGEGGCGVVYLAEQSAPVRRHVALKVIKLGMDTKAVIARFRAEQQALALMDHPNIAKVFDAGATATGRPYFVMELVRGIKITEYCEQSHLDIPERLALFNQVCQAIQHAHHKGIIHRDIKPSNVLVTLHEGVPIVKVIDFGIAKAMQGRLTDQTLYTALGQFIGTPAYVSPEQTDPGGGDVDARSDIYSLGVLLYELLTGCTPFDATELSQVGLDEMRQRIRETEPPTPSKRLSTLVGERMTGTVTRNLTAAKIIKQMQGDLDWIVMRCLEKERERRYQTASDLSLDLQRHLHHQPVTARPPSIVYTFRKFARRHRTVFATVATVVVVLLIATIVSTSLAVRARRAEQAAVRAEQLARTEAATRQEVIDFLRNDLLAQASPMNEPDRDLKLRTVLDRAAEKISGRFADSPLVEASVRETLGATYDSLGEFPIARQHFESARAIYEQQLGLEHPQTLQAIASLIDVMNRESSYAEAESLGATALQLHKKVLGPSHPGTLAMMNRHAEIFMNQGKFDQAEALQFETLQLQKQVLGEENPDTLITMNGLGLTYIRQGKSPQSEKLLARALEIQTRMLGRDHPDTLVTMNNLASAYSDQGKYAEAAELEAKALEVVRRVMGPEHPHTLVAMNNLANNYEYGGKVAEAEALKAQTLEIRRRVLGPESPQTILSMGNLAFTYREQRKFAEAQALFSEALNLNRRVMGPEHPNTLWTMRNLAITHIRQDKLAEAQALLSEGLQISKRVFRPEHPEILMYSNELGALLLKRGRPAEAEPLLRAAADGYKKSSSNDWRMYSAQGWLGEALIALRRFEEAETILVGSYRAMQEHIEDIPASRRALIGQTSDRVLRLYAAWEKPEKAQEWQRGLTQSAGENLSKRSE